MGMMSPLHRPGELLRKRHKRGFVSRLWFGHCAQHFESMTFVRFPTICPSAPRGGWFSRRALSRGTGFVAVVVSALGWPATLRAVPAAEGAPGAQPGPEVAAAPGFFIREYRILGAQQLPRDEVDMAVYPYMGPGRTEEDVELARAALEQRYHRAGYQTVVVDVPPQDASKGMVVLVVQEVPVGRLTVKGSRFHDIERIKRRAPSLQEGNVPNFEEVQRDVISLNRSRDLRVTPEFKPGALPGTVDVELVVQDSFPLHATVELNNRYSANTTPLRLDASLRYDNLWQLGHTIGAAFQIAPQDADDAMVYSGYYLAPVPRVEWLSIVAQAIRQNSDVSTLGGSASAGNGEIYGGRLIAELPPKPGLFHNLTFGLDYKNFEQSLSFDNELISSSPVTYWPFLLSYSGFWMGKDYRFQLDGAINWHFRGMGSGEVEFDNRRYAANGNYVYFRGLASYEHDIWYDFRVRAVVQGQATDNALVDSEQFSLGGLNTVRGYLESEVVGDSAIAGSLEFYSPSLLKWTKREDHEMRLFAFLDAGAAFINDPLPEQTTEFSLASWGVGGTVKVMGWLNGSLALGFPLVAEGTREVGQPLLVFRVWGEL
jgi:hemolysin activation/secretion protein